MALTDRDLRNLSNTKQNSIEFQGKPSIHGMIDGQVAIEKKSNSQLALYRKKYGKLWKSYMSSNGNQYVERDLNVSGNMVIKNKTAIGSVSSEGSLSVSSGYHKIAIEQSIRYAHSGDNTVIVELSGVKIPASAIITNVVAVVKSASNLSTHLVNVQMSATSGTAADSSISSGTELLGAGVANTDSTDSTSAQDIDLKNDPKEVWICRDTVINGSSDQYLYICNAGTGNGTTNSTSGTLTVIVDYYGMD